MMVITSTLAISLCLIASIGNALNCAGDVPDEWSQSYCPEEITRIEYQIPMDEKTLTGNTVAQIDAFLAWLVDNIQDGFYKNYFRLRTEKIKKYYRVVDELEIVKSNIAGTDTYIGPPRVSAVKYRKSFNNFKMDDSVLTYKNDLTWENAMTTPGKDLDYTSITPMPAYQDIFETKLEANIQVDTCEEGWLSNNPPLYGNTGTGFSAKIEFDDDDSYGTNDTNGLNMIDPTDWDTINDDDGSFYCDCTDPLTANCLCCEVEMYFSNYCSYFANDAAETTKKRFPLLYAIHYVLDIDFYWYKDGNGHNASADHASKGKLTFQVKYDDIDAKNADIPSDASTELSVKLYKSKTKDVLNNWHPLTKFAEDLIDVITSQTSAASHWIDHSMCTSTDTCCTNLASSSNKLISTCSGYSTQNLCEKKQTAKGGNQCQWIPCSEVGDCEWSGKGGSALNKRCPKITTKQDCETSFGGKCNWVSRNAQPPIISNDNNNNMAALIAVANNDSNYNNYGYIYYVMGVILFGMLVYMFKRYKQSKSDELGTYTPLLVSINEHV